ncbi:IclR family transcriptional regulator [Pseudonocardia nematodicida]|uniref:IclR family transcriptional regulator n=1 Tax=Pseudonocardia nematodicida TaxID=1206997 RepID=A0ABV1KGH7_9PSEU
MPRTGEPGRSVSSRLLDVLFAFRPERSALTLADLTRATGMPHATVRRLVLELTAVGALERRDDGRFTVGLRLWQLGTLAPMTEPLRGLAQPFMEDLYTALHQHVQLAVLEGHQAVIIERLSAPEAVELVSQVGGRLPLHCSGVGKVLLGHGGTELLERVLAGGLRRYTARTPTDPDAVRAETAECRRTGTATVRGELSVGADSVATRIVDAHGTVVAALAVVVRAESVRPAAVLPSVVASGLGISRALGWHPGVPVRTG